MALKSGKGLILPLCILVIALYGHDVSAAQDSRKGVFDRNPERVILKEVGDKVEVGGQCRYKKYKGRARIVSILERDEGYEVKFTFVPSEDIREDFAQTEGREFLLLLNNSSYPGEKFLTKYGIKVGKVFESNMHVITKGTCSPILFDFPDLGLGDYVDGL